ncbi:MAG: carbohydrate-binding domain-containing protein [Clostridia bacterium]|nr:carbohydrate-binding domain-containing protein [Clostridia bacterium]
MNIRKTLSIFLVLLILFAFPLSSVAESASSMFTLDDFNVPTLADAIPIPLNGENVLIQESGIYSLSGSIDEGSITIDADRDSVICLLLNGLSITSSSGPALLCNAGKVILTLADGTVNTFTQLDSEPEDAHAVLSSVCDLTINGTGKLVVNGNSGSGISCAGTLRIVSGELSVTARENGLIGRDAVCIGGGTLDVTAIRGDAISSTNREDPALGYIAVSGGILSLQTGEVYETATSREEGTEAAAWATKAEGEAPSQKGMKAEGMILFTAGSLTSDTVGDAIHAKGRVEIRGGVLELSTGSDGIEANDSLTIVSGTVHINHSFDGLESPDIHLDGGEIRISTQNDGIKAAGVAPRAIPDPVGPETAEGASPVSPDDNPLQETAVSGTPDKGDGTLTLSGGTVTILSEGDGIDVSSNFIMHNGTLYVRGSQDSKNGALNYGGTFTLTGGTLIALGFSEKAMGPTVATIPGCTLSVTPGSVTVAGTDGTSLFSFAPEGIFEHAVIYSDLFTDGETCQVISGDTVQSVIMSCEISGSGPDLRGNLPAPAPTPSTGIPESIAPAENDP